MSQTAIRCEGLSKRYRIGEPDRHKTLRDTIAGTASAPIRRLRAAFQDSTSRNGSHPLTIWALEDVSFHINRGEVVGIIGSNGAGKTTLLKILSRITKPTRGHAEIHGRVGSLLEVGTGFHPELTGRENIYLNGAILGMRRAEINRSFDSIVSFAEVEKFIDTPVKRYSSGMYVRLAFAVAAHLEPEVLLVDEVLAVGDVAFQRKCLGKIGDVAKEGRTILFVSHNMAAVQSICERAILLSQARLAFDGKCTSVIESYLENFATGTPSAFNDLWNHPNRHKGCPRLFSSLKIMNGSGEPTTSLFPGDDLLLEFQLEPGLLINRPTLTISIDNSGGFRVFSVNTDFSRNDWHKLERPATVRCLIPHVNLLPGQYAMSLSLGTAYEKQIDVITKAASFNVEQSDYFGTGRMPTPDLGVVLTQSHWEFYES